MEDSFVYLYGKKLVKFILKGVPSPLYLAMQYRFMTGEKLHFKNPRLFDEKIQQLKLMDKKPLMSVCADKFRVREYVKGCGLGDILNEIYGVYHSAGEIDFSLFKSEVFLKCNNRSGANIIYKKNQPFDKEKFAREFNGYLKDNYYYYAREWCYKDIPPMIIAERVLRDKEGRLPVDYKLFCFDGEVKIISLELNKCSEAGRHTCVNYRNMYDVNFNLLPVKDTRENKDTDTISKPENLDLMVEYARKLSSPFAHCRVDFLWVEGKIYFGEMTFYHGSGYNRITPREWAIKMGDWIDLGSKKIVRSK